ncbi:hypothetical protein CKO25_15615 [Thiocapsa imhoffii]|uniref:Tyr recombinase domain-containing protein n=1 Tax=Thiocapsa imhoffii TaxID=382777 RepID=A0A9X0WJS5_9GAMM|nr:tyrosine-type recombinase/integrase [Thiocapsa imhoffii]MBK1646047.1 hypothetical protein [Thiocapsa imhoffii]
MECVRLRVLDLDFDNGLILVRNGKGGKDRAVPLPQRLREPLQAHLTRVEGQAARIAKRLQQDKRRSVDLLDGGVFHPLGPSRACRRRRSRRAGAPSRCCGRGSPPDSFRTRGRPGS